MQKNAGTNSPDGKGTIGINFKNFNPLGGLRGEPNDAVVTPSGEEDPIEGSTPVEESVSPVQVLRQVTTYAVSGLIPMEETRVVATPITSTEEATVMETLPNIGTTTVSTEKPKLEIVTAIRYVERSTGHIKEMFTDNNYEIAISNTTIPGIQEAFFGNKGNSVILRNLKDDSKTIQTFSGTLTPKKEGDTDSELKGVFLPDNIPFLTTSLDTTRVFYGLLFNNTYQGTVAQFGGDKKNVVYNSAFTEWLPQWIGKSVVTLTTKATNVGLGYVYKLNIDLKKVEKILGGVPGMTTLLSPNEKMLLYSQSAGGSFSLNLFDITRKITAPLTNTTLPEKCVFTKRSDALYCGVPVTIPPGAYPDVWYQGLVSFSDSIWKIDPVSGLSQVIFDPISISASVDLTKPVLSEKEDYLFFVNKNDETLWQLDLAPELHKKVEVVQ